MTHRNVLALCLMYLPSSFIVYFCLKNHYGWNSDLLLIGGSFLLASLCRLFIDPRKKVFLD